jgi:hypothetical protein
MTASLGPAELSCQFQKAQDLQFEALVAPSVMTTTIATKTCTKASTSADHG